MQNDPTNQPTNSAPVPPAPAQGATNQSPQPFVADSPTPTPPSAKKSRKKALLFGGIGALVALIILGAIFIPRIIQSIQLAQLDSGLPYIYKPTMENLERSDKLEFPLGFEPTENKDAPLDRYSEYVQVYSDEAFTKPAIDTLTVYTGTNGKKLSIVPSPSVDLTKAYDVRTSQKVELAKDREWGIHEKYYVVQYADFSSGKKLEKPIVQPFTVKHELATPQVRYTVGDDGNITFSWDKVDGAKAYVITRINRLSASGGANVYGMVDSNTTSWSTKSETTNLEGFTQNRIIATNKTQDDTQNQSVGSIDAKAFTREDNVDIAVFAATETQVSGYKSVDTVALRSQAPSSFATNTARSLNIEVAGEVTDINDIPANVPVILSDGRTAMQAISINVDDVSISERGLVDIDAGRYVTTLNVPYTVKGTGLSWTYRVTNFDATNYKQQLADVVEKNRQELVKTGSVSFALLDPSNLPKVEGTPATSRPNVPYKVNGSSEFVKYIAANLIDGTELIDVSKFVDDQSVSTDDAFQEALSQNPYAMYLTGYYYSPTKKIIQVRYSVDTETRERKMKELNDKVKSITGSIIKSGMSDTQKVNAINTYIIDNAKYNYDALEVKDSFLAEAKYADAWTAYGILIDGTAVCGGYSYAFKALADEAGLESVYVTGYLDNTNRHAWNKVRVDGTWRIVDTTWNDSEGERNKYLLITDEKAESQRDQVEDKSWISDPFLKQYQAV